MAGRRVFDKYELIRRIAQGGMGDVFLARQVTGIDRLVILKSLRHEASDDRDFVEQFLDEARVAALLNHPNVVSVYDVGEWDGTFWMVMEYIKGEDLSRLWYAAAKAGIGLPFQVTVRVIHDAALGLDHAHQACDVEGHHLQIVHRDVSPQNIMVRADGVTKVVDFGIAKAKNRVTSTQAGLVKGKLQYMSPEQVRGEPLDGKSDQFSLGIVLWEMCTGKRLFKAESEIATLNKILTHPVPAPSTIVKSFPKALEGIIMTMLEREAGRRYPSCAEAAGALLRYLERTPRDKRVKVADFVQKVLGDELEQKTKDLTPETLPIRGAAPATIRTPPPRFTTASDDSALATAEDDHKPIRIERADGTVLTFRDFDEVRKEVFFGNLAAQDRISVGPNPQIPVEEHHALSHLFEEGPAEKPYDPDDETGLWVPEVAPQPVDDEDEDDRALKTLFAQATDDAPDEEEFSLGNGASLPPEPAGPVDGFSQTPTTTQAPATHPPGPLGEVSIDEEALEEDLRRALGKSRGSWGWMFAGLFFLLVSFPVGLYFAFPEVFDRVVTSLVRQSPAATPTAPPALFAALRNDDPATLQGLLATLEGQQGAYAQAASSLLHSGLARIQRERARIAPTPDKRAAAEKVAQASSAAAYAAASAARTADGTMPWAHVAMAHHHASQGAGLELEQDFALAQRHTTAHAGLVDAERKFLVAHFRLAEDQTNAVGLESLRALARAGDRRAAYLRARLLWQQGKTTQARAEVDALLTEAEGHRRGQLLLATLDGKASPPPQTTPPTTPKKTPGGDKPPGAETPAREKSAAPEKDAASEKTAAQLYQAAEKARRRGRSKSAVKLYEQALRKKPGFGRAHRGLGWARLDLGQTAASIRSFRAAVKASPSDAESHLGLAEALRFAGRQAEAVPSYKRVLELNPNREDRQNAENALRLLDR